MKLLGYTNGKQVIASVARHDYNSFGEGEGRILADGGQINIGDSAGYNKHWGRPIWIEIAQTFAELYNDWNYSIDKPRKYGLWDLADVKVLTPEEYPDTESFEWKAENAIWGTNGLEGNLPTTYVLLKDCSKEHLEKILVLCEERENKKLAEIVNYWLKTKCSS